MTSTTGRSVDDVLELFERWGVDPYDEEVGQREHALQTAALAATSGAGEELVAAALLHDIGHLLELRDAVSRGQASGVAKPSVDRRHEDRGARWLRALFPPSVTAPIALHVRAKRYLCAVDPAYSGGLSSGSTASLRRQGGAMTPPEVAAFSSLPGHADAVALRRWDDRAKTVGLDVPDVATYAPMLRGLAIRV